MVRGWTSEKLKAGSRDPLSRAERFHRLRECGTCLECPHFPERCHGNSKLVSGAPCMDRVRGELTERPPIAVRGKALASGSSVLFAELKGSWEWKQGGLCSVAGSIHFVLSLLLDQLRDASERRGEIKEWIEGWEEAYDELAPPMPAFPSCPAGADLIVRVLPALSFVQGDDRSCIVDGIHCWLDEVRDEAQLHMTEREAFHNTRRLLWEYGRELVELKAPDELLIAFAEAVR